MIQLEIEKTNRGFAVCSFEDFYGEKCSIQDSSLADTAAIWLGIDDPKPKRLVQNEGWVEVELPPGAEVFGRMHLSQEQVRALLPLLVRFAETGSIED